MKAVLLSITLAVFAHAQAPSPVIVTKDSAPHMTMFLGYGHLVDFITGFEWWTTDPHDELVDNGAYCLAKPGEIYAIYLPQGGKVTLKLEPGVYDASWFSALSGEKIVLPAATGPSWSSPETPDKNDWALLLQKRTQ